MPDVDPMSSTCPLVRDFFLSFFLSTWDHQPRHSAAEAEQIGEGAFVVQRRAQYHVVGGVGAEGAEFPSRRAIEARHPR